MSKQSHEIIDPRMLTNHPALARVSMMNEVADHLSRNHHGDSKRKEMADAMADEWNAFVTEIAANGVLEVVKVVGMEIVDGRHRVAAAIEAGLTEVPYTEVTEAEAAKIIDGTITGRRHWTKGARAYFAVLMHPEVASLKRGAGSHSKSAFSADLTTKEELCERFGVSKRLMEQAVELYQKLDGKTNLRDRIEPSIWAGIGLGNLLTGIGGAAPTAEKARSASTPATVSVPLQSFCRKLGDFGKWSPVQRAEFADDWRQACESMPTEAVEVMWKAMQETLKS